MKTKTTALVLAVAVAALVVLGAGCSQKHSAERYAKKAGQAMGKWDGFLEGLSDCTN